jgi:hypothetical protein
MVGGFGVEGDSDVVAVAERMLARLPGTALQILSA